jgi:hypothetical protein
MARFEIPDGWRVQAFQFALDCTPEQAACVRRQFRGRRYGRNWAVRTLKEDLTRYRETGEGTGAPSLAGLRKRWNQVKDAECVDADIGQVWWPQISKEAFADGIKAAVDAYWSWQTSWPGVGPGCASIRVVFVVDSPREPGTALAHRRCGHQLLTRIGDQGRSGLPSPRGGSTAARLTVRRPDQGAGSWIGRARRFRTKSRVRNLVADALVSSRRTRLV